MPEMATKVFFWSRKFQINTRKSTNSQRNVWTNLQNLIRKISLYNSPHSQSHSQWQMQMQVNELIVDMTSYSKSHTSLRIIPTDYFSLFFFSKMKRRFASKMQLFSYYFSFSSAFTCNTRRTVRNKTLFFKTFNKNTNNIQYKKIERREKKNTHTFNDGKFF